MTPEIKQRIEQIRRGEVPEGYVKKRKVVIPQQWGLPQIKDIASISSGSTPNRNNSEYWNGNIAWVTTGELSSGHVNHTSELITVKAVKETKMRIYPQGTLLMAMYGQGKTRGTVAILEIDAAVNQACAAITVKDGKSKFLFYQLKNSYQDIRKLSNTGNQENLNADIIKTYQVPWAPDEEQERISTILTTQDKVIELKEKRLAEKQRQKKYLMQQLLTGKKRLPGFSGEWKNIKLCEVLSERKEKNVEQNLRICSVAVQKGVVDQVEHLGRSYAANDTSNYSVAHYGDIIYTKSPTGDFLYGIVKQNLLQETVAVSPLYGVFTPLTFGLGYFLHTYFQSAICARNYLLPIVQKGAKNTINITNDTFISSKLYLPLDVEEQKAIADTFIAADREIELLQQDIEQEKQKKKALMQLLLTGIVRVKT
ncbi:MAG: restriction endonuclease subunit S [Oscillospiraceae bacterium]|jgi:type I restriction enzyme S subunit